MSKEINKKVTQEEAREFVLFQRQQFFEVDKLLKKVADVLPKLYDGTDAEKSELNISLGAKAGEILRILETDSYINLMEAVTEQYRGTAKELAKQITKDYGCVTSIEKTLASDIAHSYIKILDNSRRLNNEFNCRDITKNRTFYISVLSKQLDRASRQYINGIVMLKQLKAPTIEMNIRANTAFVSQNQQFNVDKKINEA